MEEYKALGDFEVEVVKGSAAAYGYSFEDCQAQVHRLFLQVDANLLDPKAAGNKEEEGRTSSTSIAAMDALALRAKADACASSLDD